MKDAREYSVDELVSLLPLPAFDTNKYTRGVLTAVVGSARYPGAACLAAYASQRTGAGYTEVITSPAAAGIVSGYRPSLVVRSWDHLTPADMPCFAKSKPCACLVGSGFDAKDDCCLSLTYFTLKQAKAPVVVDGSGLSALVTPKGRRILKRRFLQGLSTIVTPHAGEAARLAAALNLSTNNPAELSRLISLAFGVVAVVKGPHTFISDGEQIIRMANGTPALAKAGTGDVLAGMIAALLAQGLSALDAAVLGAELHGRAGQSAEKSLCAISVTAEDVIDHIPHAILKLAASTDQAS